MSKCYDIHPAPETLAFVTLGGAAEAAAVLELVLQTHVPLPLVPYVQEVIDALHAITNDTDAIVIHGEFF